MSNTPNESLTMAEYVDQVSFKLGIPANINVENISIEKAVQLSFQELKEFMGVPVDKTVPFSTRLDLVALGIYTVKVRYVYPAIPKVGMNLNSVDSGNVFAMAASAQIMTGANLDSFVQQLARAQVSNVLSTDFQWTYDMENQVIYCTCKQPHPGLVTIRYIPNYTDVSQIKNPTWINYITRMSEANMKVALGRSRSKYRVEGSNVTLDGEILLQEGTAELQQIREELKPKKRKLRVLT